MIKNKKIDYVSLTYPHNRPGPQRPDLRTTEIKTGFHIKDFNKACPSVFSTNKIEWNTIRSVGKSDFGTSGVIFVETDEGACAIKGSQEIAVEYFSNLLFKALKISIPEMKLVAWNEIEFKLIQENLDRCTFDKSHLNRIIRNRMNCPFLIVMAYIPSITIGEMGEKRAKHIFDSNYPSSRDRLIRIGMIIATDTFINNCDRYPLIWKGLNGEENEGNPENLLVKVETDFLSSYQNMIDPTNMDFAFTFPYAIDNRPNLLKKNDRLTVPNLIRYHTEFEKFLKLLFEDLKEVKEAKIDPLMDSELRFRSIGKIVNFIHRQTGYRLKAMSEFQIMLGMVLQYVNIVEMGSQRIHTIHQELYQLNEKDWKDIWKNSYEKINLEFLVDSIGIIRKFLITYDEVVLWVKSITLQQYIIKWSEEDEKQSLLLNKPNNDNPLDFHKNLENILQIEGDIAEWELKDKSNSEEEKMEDMKFFEKERQKKLENLKKQKAEKNEWLEEKLMEYFNLDENTLVKKKEQEEKEKAEEERLEQEKLLREIEKKKEKEEAQKKIELEKLREEEEKKSKFDKEEEEKKKKKGFFSSFFSKKKTKEEVGKKK